MQTAVRVEGLSKQYRLGEMPVGGMLRERITNAARSLRRRVHRLWTAAPAAGPSTRTIWALDDVSFELPVGEVLGVIGGNGAGKSTLLKILSRITPPTRGRARIRGRVGSLLEVGTGFHPDLTGRENIFLNGAILGMTRREIAAKFDEIVAFAEVGAFVDTPVKYYSSGMYVRLAFAVAAHLEPEVLIIDEVLAVGDARFQKKCLGKIDEVARGGRTVLFVSHNMAAVQRLCTRALVLEKGRVVFSGEPRAAVARYLAGDGRPKYVARGRTGEPQVLRAELLDASGRPLARAFTSDPIVVELEYVVPDGYPDTRVGIGILSADGVPIFTSEPSDTGARAPSAPGLHVARVTIGADVLLAGDFLLATCLWNGADVLDWQEPALAFAVDPGTSAVYAEASTRKGFVQVPCRWTFEGAMAGERRP
ncbi:MAG: ABC transporter ATP-binding protein [Acidobacteriota bacterium]